MSLMTITATEHRVSRSHMPFSRNSNTAGAPLPLIPRRSPSTSRFPHTYPLTPPRSSSPPLVPTTLVIHPPTPTDETRSDIGPGEVRPPQGDTDSSSSSPSDESRPTVSPRARRVRGQRYPSVCPPEHSTPTPAVLKAATDAANKQSNPQLKDKIRFPSRPSVDVANQDHDSDDDTPRPSLSQRQARANVERLRLDLTTSRTRNLSESHADSLASIEARAPTTAPIEIPSSVESNLLRKKSGEPLKSSLKSMKRQPRGSLSVVTTGISTKSEPSTPTHAKAVHFDAQLEHVKLFLAEQKPLAVSRDGSPTDDTSGTDSDFPSFIYGSSDDENRVKSLTMQVINMPKFIKSQADVALSEMALSNDKTSVTGRVRVRNIAFEKRLAVRFTFDLWQTTSEVTAKYIESQDGGTFDVFGFTIRLNDLIARIEEKSLFVALRYTVNGKEIWDNNGGADYHVRFSRSAPSDKKDPDSPGERNMARLKSKLEQVAKGRDNAFVGQGSRKSTLRAKVDRAPPLNTDPPLSARYDFATSFRTPWKGPASPPSTRHSRTNTYPSSSSTIPWPQKLGTPIMKGNGTPIALGSPRDLAEDGLPRTPYLVFDQDDSPLQDSYRLRGRNHRRGYFDVSMPDASEVRKTPPGTPKSENSALPRTYSYPPIESTRPKSQYEPERLSPSWPEGLQLSSGSSAESTPSITSPSSSSRSSSPSPSEPPITASLRDTPGSPGTDYSVFLNRYCFYSGPDSLSDLQADLLPRSHSVSSVEGFLSSQSPPMSSFTDHHDIYHYASPTRSPNSDGVSYRSGSSTPLAKALSHQDSRSPTPVAG